MSYRAIGERLGVSHEAARQQVLAELAAVAADAREEAMLLREIEHARLERLVACWLPKAEQGDLRAAEMLIRLSARLSALHGLDGPARLEHSGAVGMVVTRDLADQIAAARAAADRAAARVQTMPTDDDGETIPALPPA